MEDFPTTGDGAVDEILRKVARLGEVPLAEHAQILREAQNALHGFLNSQAYAT